MPSRPVVEPEPDVVGTPLGFAVRSSYCDTMYKIGKIIFIDINSLLS